MNRLQEVCCLIPVAYVLGSTPFGLWVGLAKGVDPRKSGSGNTGATNIGRILGGKFFALVLMLDLLKGLIPTLLAGWLFDFKPDDRMGYCLWIAVGVAAIFGHMFSIFMRFRGGKGVATSAGVTLGFFPYLSLPCVLAIISFYIVFKATRFVSVASMVASIVIPTAYAAIGYWREWPRTGEQLPVLVLSALIPVLIIYRHRGNIQRLRSGTENRFKTA